MSERSPNLILADADAVFRLGLTTALLGEFQVLAQVGSFQELNTLLKTEAPDLIVLDPVVPSQANGGWRQVRHLRRAHPGVKLCLLTASLDYDNLAALQSLGIEGYFPKGTAPAALKEGFRRLLAGETLWSPWPGLSQPSQLPPAQRWLWRGFAQGFRQIDGALAELEQTLTTPNLSDFDRLFWRGRRRELQAARWLAKRLVPGSLQSACLKPVSPGGALALTPAPLLPQVLANPPLINDRNLTGIPLEIDILQEDKRRELLQLCWSQWERFQADLRRLQATPEQLPADSAALWGEIWQSVALGFLGKYGAPKETFKLDDLQALLASYRPVLERESLAQIPQGRLLLERALGVDSSVNINETTDLESDPWALYLHHALIQVANGVMVFTLNYFPHQEVLKQSLYQSDLISSRAIAKFRNNLTWHYQWRRFWLEPKNIFESRHELFYFSPQGIEMTVLYAPRQAELEHLKGLPWLATMALELRDALSPRLRALIAFAGQGVVFVLTQVIGRGLGLIAKGIFQGMGGAWQEGNSKRPF
ncbi:MAG: DUF3685 domain-containing protein [Cyanobacteriota bacterium]|jgi:CheY-like chemotaxis protein